MSQTPAFFSIVNYKVLNDIALLKCLHISKYICSGSRRNAIDCLYLVFFVTIIDVITLPKAGDIYNGGLWGNSSFVVESI